MNFTISSTALLASTIVLCYAPAASALNPARALDSQPQANGRSVIGATCQSQPNGSCRIMNVVAEGPAEHAGLHPGDVLLGLQNGKKGSVTEQIAALKPGTRTMIEFRRDNEQKQTSITTVDELEFYTQASARGDHLAETLLGEDYTWGYNGIPENTALGISLLRKAADSGQADAQDDLGTIYYKGHGVGADPQTAVSWYRKSAEQGLAKGEHDLAEMYMYAEGFKDPKAAFEWYKKAAEQGDASSQWSLGGFYEQGLVVAKNDQTSASWYGKAAENGLPQAQAHLGSMYFDGIGMPKDDSMALKWFRQAAENNQSEAEFGLGVMYAYGRGVPKNDATALSWYRKAAAQNDPAAEYFIGKMYETGTGVAKDLNTAKEWYKKSASHGYPDAAARLQQLR
jgi:TPR repeat protein